MLWSPDNRVMPPAHGPRLAELAPRGRYAEIPGAAVLSMLDQPQAVACEIDAFLTAAAVTSTSRPRVQAPSILKPTFKVTWKCAIWPSSM